MYARLVTVAQIGLDTKGQCRTRGSANNLSQTRSGQVRSTKKKSLCSKTVQGRKLQVHKCFTFIFVYEMVGITNKVYHMSHCFSNKWVLELLLQ